MKRLSLAELKAQSGNVVANLEAIKGGNADGCHGALSKMAEEGRILLDAMYDRLKKGPIVLF